MNININMSQHFTCFPETCSFIGTITDTDQKSSRSDIEFSAKFVTVQKL